MGTSLSFGGSIFRLEGGGGGKIQNMNRIKQIFEGL